MSSMPNDNGFLRPARVPYKVLYSLLFTLIVVIIVLLLPANVSKRKGPELLESGRTANMILIEEESSLYGYNTTYPLTEPISKYLP